LPCRLVRPSCCGPCVLSLTAVLPERARLPVPQQIELRLFAQATQANRSRGRHLIRLSAPIGSIILLLALLASESAARGTGYTYAGVVSPGTVAGVAATVSVDFVDVRGGHVAAWGGVGGPGLG